MLRKEWWQLAQRATRWNNPTSRSHNQRAPVHSKSSPSRKFKCCRGLQWMTWSRLSHAGSARQPSGHASTALWPSMVLSTPSRTMCTQRLQRPPRQISTMNCCSTMVASAPATLSCGSAQGRPRRLARTHWRVLRHWLRRPTCGRRMETSSMRRSRFSTPTLCTSSRRMTMQQRPKHSQASKQDLPRPSKASTAKPVTSKRQKLASIHSLL